MDKKRLLYLVGFLIITIILGILLYIIFFKPKTAPSTPTQPGSATPPAAGGQFPTTGSGTGGTVVNGGTGLPSTAPTRPSSPAGAPNPINTVIADAVVNPHVDTTGRINFYDQRDGKFYRIGPDGKPQLLSSSIFYDVQKVTWSPTKNASILEYPDGSKTYYDFDTNRQVTLPKYWENFSFAPSGDQIAAKSIGYSPENRWLITSNPDGSNVSLVAPLGNNADKVSVDWSPNRQIVATSLTGSSLGPDRQELLFVGLHGENFKSTVVEGRDIRSAWSPDGNKLLYSAYSAQNDYKPELWIVNANGDAIGSGRKLLNVQTWADKCAFAGPKTVYCGVPTKLDTGVGFAPQLADSTQDVLVKIDIDSGAQTPIYLPEYHVIDHITVDPSGQHLYFTDKQSQGVFSVQL